MKKDYWTYACINKCEKGFFIRRDNSSMGSIDQYYCFNTFDEAVAFIKVQMGE